MTCSAWTSQYGGEASAFSSLCAGDADSAILNLEKGETITQWGRLIFHVADVDAFWKRLRDLELEPERPLNASWGERYFRMHDPDGHGLSFAQPLQAGSANG